MPKEELKKLLDSLTIVEIESFEKNIKEKKTMECTTIGVK